MKPTSLRTLVIAAICVSLLLVIWVFAQTPAASPVDLSRLVPAGPLLYLEAKDFGALLSDWNGSAVKKLWLDSDNFQVFSRSRLYLKLQQAQTEFSAAAGVPPDMDLLANIAGTQSALAIYDIGTLEIVYITRLSSDKFAGGALWKTRGSYQPRQSSGIDYYIKTDPASKRTAAFAVAKDFVVLATREDVLAGALSLIAGQNGSSVAGEQWFDRTVREAKSPAELRMVMNLESLTRSPHFRSYWVQQNITELKQFAAAVSDAGRSSGELRENRILLRSAEITPDWNEAALGQVLRLVPQNPGLYRAWASPSSAQAFELIRQKLLEPRPDTKIASKLAPLVQSSSSAGDEADLETRIDEPPLDTGAPVTGAELHKILNGVKIEALLDVGSTRVQQDGVFVGMASGVALLAASDWDANAVRDAVAAALASQLSAGQLGVRWIDRGTGASSYSQLDGLEPLALRTAGPILIIANRPELLEAMAAGLAGQPLPGARYAALYCHSRELPGFLKMMRLIDHPLTKDSAAGDTPQPSFFSGNIASLGQTLASIDSESILVHDTSTARTESVVYKLK